MNCLILICFFSSEPLTTSLVTTLHFAWVANHFLEASFRKKRKRFKAALGIHRINDEISRFIIREGCELINGRHVTG